MMKNSVKVKDIEANIIIKTEDRKIKIETSGRSIMDMLKLEILLTKELLSRIESYVNDQEKYIKLLLKSD